jgi:choline-sulfatase
MVLRVGAAPDFCPRLARLIHSAEGSGLGRLIDFFLCGSFAWFALLLLEIDANQSDAPGLLGRTLFLLGLATRLSALLCVPLAFVHLGRAFWVRKTRRADRFVTLAIALLLALPTYQQAELLSSGGLLFESRYALLVRYALLLAMLLANLGLWHVHLWLCDASGYQPWQLISVVNRLSRRLSRAASVALWFAPGVLLLVVFANAIKHELRASEFLSKYLLPSAWLFAATLVFAVPVQRRFGRWLRVCSAALVALGWVGASLASTDVSRASAEFERRGGTAGLTQLWVSIRRHEPVANLDISQPMRFVCRPSAPRPQPSLLTTPVTDRRNVILISVDALRKDALTTQFEGRPLAPTLQALAARSLRFERAVTTYPATLFALGSALTGRSPSEVLFAPNPPDTLLTATRYDFDRQLIALPSVRWFRSAPVPQLLIQKAVPSYFANAKQSTDWMIDRLREARFLRLRTFAWIHYYEPHTFQKPRPGSMDEQRAKRSYASLVRLVDQQIGRLIEELELLGYMRDSLLILFADHGEALGELNYFGHHVYLNQFVTDIPLLVQAPGLTAQRSDRLVLISDIAPTVLEWVQVAPPATDARSLFARVAVNDRRFGMSEAFPIRGRALYDIARVPIHDASTLAERMRLIRAAAVDYQPKVSLVSSQYRLIVNRVTSIEEFYDRERDPGEQRNLSLDQLPVQREMREALRNLHQQLSERIYCRVIGQSR